MSQASQKNRIANSLTLNPAKPSAKTKNERTSVDGTEINQKPKDVVAKDTKEGTKVIIEEKSSTKKEKKTVVAEVAKTEKNVSKNDEKLKNGSSTNSEDSTNTKISNGSHKIEESGTPTTEEKKTRETRQKTTAVKDNKLESVETVNDTKLEKAEKPAEKPAAAIKEKEKDKDTTKSNQKDKEKDKETTKPNQKDKKQDKEEKPSSVRDTPKKDTKDAKSLRSQTASPKEKDTKEVSQPITDDAAKSKSKPDAKKIEEVPEEVPALKDEKPKEIAPVLWDNEEMEPLMMQVDIEEKTPAKESAPPTLTSTPTPSSRILRMRSGPPERNASPLSLYTIDDPKNNTSTCVNLSSLTNPHTPDKSYGAKIRSVSGRRPMLRDITCQNSYREHVRYNEAYSPSSINESTSSGYLDQSQRSVNTSSFIVRKRYNEDHIVEEIESQKRPRLDVSSLLTLVASPVTMLRNRLARARIQSSTPNTTSNINKDDIEIDTVTASCIDEPKSTETEEEEEEGLQDEFLENDDEDIKELPRPVDYGIVDDDIEMHTDIQIKILKEENKQSSPFVPKEAIKKKWNCSLM